MTIGERLLSQRRLRKLTQQQLSSLSGVSQAMIARIEKGSVHEPGASVIRRLARALGVTADYLIGMYDDASDDSSSLRHAYAPG